MSPIEKILQIEKAKTEILTIHRILGRYSDRLTPTIYSELHKEVSLLQQQIDKKINSFKL